MPPRRIVWGGRISGEAAGQEEPCRHNQPRRELPPRPRPRLGSPRSQSAAPGTAPPQSLGGNISLIVGGQSGSAPSCSAVRAGQ
jgi:hypothetical protein